MGNSGSQVHPKSNKTPSPTLPKHYISKKSSRTRLEALPEPRAVHVTGKDCQYDLTYAFVSQKGYYPDALAKANQDSFCISEQIVKDGSGYFFGVFDGHGESGDLCAHFAAEKISKNFKDQLNSSKNTDIDNKTASKMLTTSFEQTNSALHKSTEIDDHLSGTTAVAVFLHNGTIHVANTGDSRAILGRFEPRGGKSGTALKAYPLSVDQTPFRRDERERVTRKGALIRTMRQISGDEALHQNWDGEQDEPDAASGDPPRVWDSSLTRPGCAFTRSLGDTVAESVGVIATPEVLSWQLGEQDRYVVLASDGLFEFLGSQTVMDTVAKFGNPLEAAKHLALEAYRLWLTYDERTDDITIIVLTIKNFVATNTAADKECQSSNTANDNRPESVAPAAHAPSTGTAASNGGSSLPQLPELNVKPVRREMSSEKRKIISECWSKEDKPFILAEHIVKKSPEDVAKLSEMVKPNFLFQNLSSSQRDQILLVMKGREVAANELIIRQGDEGDEMFIVDRGLFDVEKTGPSGGAPQVVFTYTAAGSIFGELSLMYGKPRAASVRAKTDGKLWSIGRLAFRSILMRRRHATVMKLLRMAPALSAAPVTKLQRLADLSTEEYFNVGELVAESEVFDDAVWVMLLVLEGTLQLHMLDKKKKKKGEGAVVGSCEFKQGLCRIEATRTLKILRVSQAAMHDVFGVDVAGTFSFCVTPLDSSSSSLRYQSILSIPENLVLPHVPSRSEMTRASINIVLGQFAYIGTFSLQNHLRSIKVVSKIAAKESQLDENILNERLILAALQGCSENIAKVASTFQNRKVAMLVFSEVFLCDLSHAIISSAIAANSKPAYCAGIYSAISSLHAKGIIHRLVTSYAVYVSQSTGAPVLCDMRYAKSMDGSKNFTMCGDVLYFSPEMIGQQGYDYCADLWAFGILCFELYEGSNPFAKLDTDEAQVFRTVSSYRNNNIPFTEKNTRTSKLLNFRLEDRLGYKDAIEVLQHPFLKDIDWEDINYGTPNITADYFDDTNIFDESVIPDHQSSTFDRF